MNHFKRSGNFDPSTLSGLMVAIEKPDGTRFEGTLVNFTGGTLKVQFWGEELPHFGLTQPISIFINGLNLDLPALPACAMERNELPGGRSYRFAYTLTPEFQELIPEDLWVLFPSRASHRVRPSMDAPVKVYLGSVDGEVDFEARVLDLSTTGVGLAVDRETEAQLHDQGVLRIQFQFPGMIGQGNSTTVFGKVMHRRMAGSELRYGVSFDTELELETVGQDALIRYIVGQERPGA